MRLHLEGMWVAFALAAGFIVYFVQRMTRALAAREAELVAARAASARHEKLMALATGGRRSGVPRAGLRGEHGGLA
jgi:two-component system, sensor histidine kinase RegB